MTPNMEEQGSQLDNTIPGFNDNNEENLQLWQDQHDKTVRATAK